MSAVHGLRRLAAAIAFLPLAALAGGPLSICGPATQPSTSNVAVKYPTASVTLTLDQGTLGPLTNGQANSLVSSAVALWTNVSTANINIAISASPLSTDITAANYNVNPPGYYNNFTDGVNPVIYDTDGTIVDAILGSGASNSVLGFAGSASYGYPTCQYAEGQAVMSGKLLTSGAITQAQMSNVITHEIGHLIGMDHTQLDSGQGLPTSNYPMMYPIAYRTTNTLHEDDAAAVTSLYPDTTANGTYGTLSGTFTTAGGAPVPGANLWAQGAAGTFSAVSDTLAQGTGAFSMRLLPGTYTLHAEAIHSSFTGGSSVGPYADASTDASFQSPLYSGSTPMTPVTLGGGTPTQITITAGCSGTVTFRIDGTGTLGGNCNVPPPAAPTLVSPSGTITTATPTFTWNSAAGATSYELLVQNTSGVAIDTTYTASVAGCASGGTCSAAPGISLTNGATYNWFVRASNAGGTSAWSAATPITVNVAGPMPPPAPTPVSPTGSLATTTPTYTWNASSGATSYMLLVQNTSGVAINTSFTATAAGCGAGTGTCSVTPSVALAAGATYSWFVNATNSVGTSAWSAATTITAPAPTPPAAPTLVSPTGTITTATPGFTWNAVSNAATYRLVVRNASSVAVIDSTVSPTAAACPTNTGMCSLSPGTSLSNGGYTWTVAATNTAGTGTSATGSFTVSVTVAGPPAAPTLVSPSGIVTTATPTYTWNASSGATSYQLLVQNTSGVAVNTSVTATAAGCGAGSGTCSMTPSIALANLAAYNWFVNATNANGTSAWSAGNSINIALPGPTPPAVPVTVSPSGAITTATPTYTWNASSGATSYYLLVQNTSGVAVSMSVTATAAGCGAGTGTCSVMPSTALSNGASYNWFVNATNSVGTSAWSAARSISVSVAGPSVPAAPVPLSPMGTVTTATPAYTWNASTGATSYYLLVQNTSGVAVSTSVTATAAGCGAGTGTCSITPSTSLSNGATYNWFVNASNSFGTSAWSAATAITVSAAGPSVPLAPTLVSPSGSTGTRTPTYTWNASTGATSYYLLVQNTAGVAVSTSVTATAAGCGAGTGTCSMTPSTMLGAATTYVWFVNATNSLGTSAWSAGKTITTP